MVSHYFFKLCIFPSLRYGFVAESFEEHILPACHAYWQKKEMPDRFIFSADEVFRSITTYKDPYGHVGYVGDGVT